MRRTPTRATVVFEAWRGRYSDSPRAISEALTERHQGIAPVWVAGAGSRFPGDVKQVRRYSVGHLRHLATSGHVVTNDIITKPVLMRPGCAYLQTWHGSPIKKIGLHENTSAYRGAAAHRTRMLRDVRRWRYLLSPSPVYTEIFRGAFGFEGDVLEIGNPRNDILVNDDGRRRAQVRQALGVRPDERVLLYAPTWREDCGDGTGSFHQPELVDWGALQAQLPEDVLVLSRMHANVRSGVEERAGIVRDVSRHPDVTDLLLAADGLISDYSSVVHDFAVTGRPIYLHAPDLDRYRESVRELYFDYEEWAPGPISTSTSELAHNIVATPVADEDARTAFLKEYCTFEDGRATEKVVDLILGQSRGAAS